MASKIINTCVVLHNMCLHHNIPPPEHDDDVLNADFGIYNEPLDDLGQHEDNGNVARINQDLYTARQLRNRIIQTHFRQ